MNAERMLAHYERIADAPDAIARLRRFILDLAVRGKLVPQDPMDEPAAKLLKSIPVEKARLVKAGEIRKRDELPEVAEAEYPFVVPLTWSWCRLGSLGWTQTGTTPPKAKSDHYGDFIPFIKPGDIYPKFVDYLNEGLSKQGIAESGRVAPSGSVLMVCIGTIGKCQRIDRDCSFNQQINSISPFSATDSHYLLAACQSEMFQKAAWAASARTTIAILNKGNWELLVVPLPPLAEQHRIVAKVDELMALCDLLEAARAEREATRDRLAASSLARLNAPDPETFQDDARFVLNALPALTTRPDQIKQLRQTILNLAVRGKLVPQDAKDEPAAELLKRVAKEKAKSTGRNKVLPEIEDLEKTFEAPASWRWVRMGSVFSIRTGFAFKSVTYADKGTLVFRVTNFDRDGSFDLSDVVFFPTEQIDSKMSGFLMEPGEVIMVMVGGTIGKTTIVDESILPALLNQNMWRIRSFGGVMSSKFEYLLIKNINQSIQGLTQSTHGHFAMSDYEKRVFPLPPLAEQHRIVAKVDELMGLCDQLEASLTDAGATRRRLLDALLAEALEPAQVRESEAVA